ncbi:nucleotidyltransferase domain-containing protein [Bacillus sp. IITD106]|nr:nucleotidyltransferase domain-containing protein [Bacillus sp. IITD106]
MIKINSEELLIIQEILRQYVPNAEVRVFGSRHKGNIKDTSDLDLVIINDKKIDLFQLAMLKEAFEESTLPFRVDVLDWYRITEDFRKHIEESYTVLKF